MIPSAPGDVTSDSFQRATDWTTTVLLRFGAGA